MSDKITTGGIFRTNPYHLCKTEPKLSSAEEVIKASIATKPLEDPPNTFKQVNDSTQKSVQIGHRRGLTCKYIDQCLHR